jgi:hypothetical protein
VGVIIKAIRDSARGEVCTLRTAWCNHDVTTVVFCHGPRLGTAGTGQKVDDWWGAYGCSECHEAVDQHRITGLQGGLMWLHAILTTQRRLYEKGIMQFPETTRPPRTVSKIVPHSGRMRR